MGVELDEARNTIATGTESRVSTGTSRVEVWVVPTDEELLIARDTVRVVQGLESRY
jgi:acetate kinase